MPMYAAAGGPPPPPGASMYVDRAPTAWEQRSTLGFFRALWLQWQATVLRPDEFWRRVRPDGPAGDALWYGWLIALVQSIIMAPLLVLQFGLQFGALGGAADGMSDLPPELRDTFRFLGNPGGWVVMAALFAAVGVALYPVQIILTTCFIHLGCLLFGASKYGFWATFRVLAYGSAPNVLVGVPCLGIAASVYTFVQWVWGLMRVHETTGGRATMAVLFIPILLICGCGVLMLVSISALFASLR